MDAGNGANNRQIIDGKDIPSLRQAVCLKRQGWHPRVAPGGRQANAKMHFSSLSCLYLYVYGIVFVMYLFFLFLRLVYFAHCCRQLLQSTKLA